ncbi:RNA methyltransferase tRNA(m5U54)methyltransferase [Friedmanniomyces endolithicus]|uniref:tRNA (guanine(26)-N(2))-dimethyltransferase n=1 Tax=Friedmanniomyces endolithicus TaxID=329885 RepID=A0AAN6FDY5_9PEZI|nr:RNA methyltransferase tRNA(m5U54)methyltransferase [Friedmanniomyces endolithicus]KAK0272826.1 RNA methyltransferase tRNA(m5U54)methyltransferase [Friedmanniomyces endolithicus]KAK0315934.1 RNA methyltransferase tRNA(m5U54)methyltransferase [Friedmanniomyces endolithicus]KAK0976564.1 RNA methyltransferase tRNA(m5U54)methyltransferase [Friedmanniomyces endolithicus]
MSTTAHPQPETTKTLRDPPATGQLVQHEGKVYETIREGRAFILIPPGTQRSVDPSSKTKPKPGVGGGGGGEVKDVKDVAPQGVFYNPIQQFNRDLSVLAIRAFGEAFCERRRVEHERVSGKAGARKERKRQRRRDEAVAGGEIAVDVVDGEGDGGVETGVREAGEMVGLNGQTDTDDGAAQHAGLKRKADAQDEGEEHRHGVAKVRVVEVGSAVAVRKGGAVPDNDEHGAIEGASQRELATDGDSNGIVTHAQPSEDAEKAYIADTEPPAVEGVSRDVDGTNGQTQTLDKDHLPQPWRPKFRILDALSATGLRALRYAAEIPFATAVTANDMDRSAVKSIRTHIEHNQLSDKITATLGNAIGHMYNVAFPPTITHGPTSVAGKYDVIDLDPYGTAAPFIDSALQALNDGGLLCVTCTDSAVFASCGYAEKTYSLYGGMPIKGAHSHEGGLRLVINSVASAAAKYGLAIEPLLSLSIDFYVRIFIRVTKSPADVKFLAGKTMLVYGCDTGCGAWHTQMLGRNTRQTGKGPPNNPPFKHGIALAPSTDHLCEHCNSKMHVAGPMWAGPILNRAFVEKILDDAKHADQEIYQTLPRLEGMLDTALNELAVLPEPYNGTAPNQIDTTTANLPKTPPDTIDTHPFFFIPSALAKVLHCVAPGEAAIKGALRHAGYRATRSHCKPGSIKTDAPWSVVWEVMREWVRQKAPVKEGALREGSPGWWIMRKARKSGDGGGGTAKGPGEGGTETMGVTGAEEVPKDVKLMKVIFDEALGRDKPGKKKLVRYQANPRENWGPMTRAKGHA